MKQAVLSGIENVHIYPIISLLIFVALFIGVIIYVIRMDKSVVKEISSLPIQNNEFDNENDYDNETDRK